MPKYTYQAGAHWPLSLIDLTHYKDADNTVGELIAQIKAYQEAGDFDAAQAIITDHAEELKPYAFDSAAINKYVEETRNIEIYTKSKKQQVFYEPTEEQASNFITINDVWLGNVGDSGSIIEKGNAIDSQVLEGATYIGHDGTLHTGTMRNNEDISVELSTGEIFQIPAGYHNGGGIITATGGSPSGGTITLPTFTTNGFKKGFDVSAASFVQFQVNVPTVMTGTLEVQKGKTQITFEREISQFMCVVGLTKPTSTNSIYSSWGKDGKGTWRKYTYNPTANNYKISDISGNTATIEWSNASTITYWAW